MIAPFWADIDFSYGNGTVYYHEYNRDLDDKQVDPLYVIDQFVFDMADSDVRTGVGDTAFYATSVVIITWENASPFPSTKTYETEVRV